MSKKLVSQEQQVQSVEKMESFAQELAQGNVKHFMAGAKGSSRDLWFVDRADIQVLPDFNARVMNEKLKAHIRSIADSIKENGYFADKPLAGFIARVNNVEVLYVTDGHCRLAACDLAAAEGAEVSRIPVVIAAKGTSMEDLTVALARTAQSRPLEAYELAIICKRLSRFNLDEDTISKRLGISRGYVENLLRLAGAPAGIRNMVIEDRISATAAVEAMKAHGELALSKLEEALNKAMEQGSGRITKKNIEPTKAVIFKKHITKAAPQLYSSLREISQDQGYAQLSPELREKLNAILDQLSQVEVQDEDVMQTS